MSMIAEYIKCDDDVMRSVMISAWLHMIKYGSCERRFDIDDVDASTFDVL
jgi:hypothetical protein